ncbi:GNAT family N-acetyltransferase [Marininema mesophilum]|uniref:GNAT family N-acetyltransferase n=1 Tax=Marininema mesophilum TaxID=1048340 RepID=UPI0015A5DCC7|nr:GNAT family protein [Marininema mesophilum]
MGVIYHLLEVDQVVELVSFLSGSEWPYHEKPFLSEQDVRASWEKELYSGVGKESYLMMERGVPVGFLRLFDLTDSTALFDIRIASNARGRGLGKKGVNWLTEHLFCSHGHIERIEAYTRVDNEGMRRTLLRCGYVMEGYHRRSWSHPRGLCDSVAYAMLRTDWETGKMTPVPLDEFMRF